MNQVRVIGGDLKRRLIRFEDADGLRPTPDRIRETLFNWLMWDVSGRRIVDACAGSGALGIEALSRGASHVTFIEPNKKQLAQLKTTLNDLGLSSRAALLDQPAEHAIAQIASPIDGLFLDPPYALKLWTPLATAFDPKLAPQAWVYVEADREHTQLILPSRWQKTKHARAGQVHAGLYRLTDQ